MSTLKGSRALIERKANTFMVKIIVENEGEKKEGQHTVPKQVAPKRCSSAREMEVDVGQLLVRNMYGALTVEGEEAYEESYERPPCGTGALFFAGRGWRI